MLSRSMARTRYIAWDAYQSAFEAVDREPECNGNDAGRVATAVEMAFRIALSVVKGDPIDPEDRAVLERMLTKD